MQRTLKRNASSHWKHPKAFTLIEVIVVMAIIAVLVLLGAPKLMTRTKEARDTQYMANAKVLEDAVDRYEVEHGKFPRLSDTPYSVAEVNTLFKDVYDVEGNKVTLDARTGNYYDLDFDKLAGSIKGIPDNERARYILRNPVGSIYYVENLTEEIASRAEFVKPKPITTPGVNLVKNGDGSWRNNTNFRQLTFDASDGVNGKPSFTYEGAYIHAMQNEHILVDTDLTYRLSYSVKGLQTSGNTVHGMVVPYDADGKIISPGYTMFYTDTLTRLSKDLNPGDTVVYLKNASKWRNNEGKDDYKRRFIFWNYRDTRGRLYPPLTYSRNGSDANTWADGGVNFENNTITLTKPWEGPRVLAGTPLSNGSSGGTYKYLTSFEGINPDTWTHLSGTIQGIDYSGDNVLRSFPPGTASVKVGWLLNRYGPSGGKNWLSDIRFEVVPPSK